MILLFVLNMFAAEVLPPCPTEDSANCVWEADLRGNGRGESFYNLAGVVIAMK